ncbi:hypothetical protein [Sphingomonas sp. SUN039]|uniref:hypothetical protein n=1 Tax=Sphingomonas sp. SUN039 TaxID=2937787 RepID=UPI00216472C6|nr:hypothetical protein [Sphingomonas sp. SUN039]UVO55554.1 hypothetical protein M0209_16040 [Sphingomonas sp. SUN039]
MKSFKLFAAIAVAPMMLSVAAPAMAQNYPLVAGDYAQITDIKIESGGDYDYANWLAGQWRKNQEFAKAQGWIKDFKIWSNVYSRSGEADIYLMVTMAAIPDGPEGARRREAYRKFVAQSDQQLAAASGDRGKFRKVLGTTLLQELKFK